MKTKILLLTVVILVFFINFSIAQENTTTNSANKFSIGLNAGSLLPYLDIKGNDVLLPAKDEWKFGGGAVLNYQLSPLFSVQGQLLMGKLAGVKKNFTSNTGPYYQGYPVGLKFDSEFYEIDLNFTVSLNRLLTPCYKYNNWLNVYALIGVGYMNFRSRLWKLDGTFVNSYGWKEQGTVKKEPTREAVLPIGIGMKFKLSNKFDVYLESTLRNVHTDKLDAYVRPYNEQDKYGYTSLGFVYRFGKKDKKHMEWVLPVCSDRVTDYPNVAELEQKIKDLEDKVKTLESTPVTQTQIPTIQIPDYSLKWDTLNKNMRDLIDAIKNINVQPVVQTVQVNPADLKPGVELGELIRLNPIYFDFDKYDIRPDAKIELDKIVEIMNRYPTMEIELKSHTDCRGSEKYNFELSQKRAYASADYIKRRITNPNRIYGRGYGESEPKIPCNCGKKGQSDCEESQHQLNRRTEFIIIKM